MRLKHGRHLAYCTNIHRGETWAETFAALQSHTLAVRNLVAASEPFGIGLRLSGAAVRELQDGERRREFQRWLDRHDCYVFTLNGFPYGTFHQTRVKESVYQPDWATLERLDYTKALFDLLAELVPPGGEGSVSTLPGSFKGFAPDPATVAAMRRNLWSAVDHVAALAERTGRDLHLGLEPEPLCWLETTEETVAFFTALRAERPGDARLTRHLGVNYDTCHLAIEFETPGMALERLRAAGIRLSKLHLSNALRVWPTAPARAALAAFADEVYLHQVIAQDGAGRVRRWRDLPEALADSVAADADDEWRVHFHLPLHAAAMPPFTDTSDHLLGALDWLAAHPGLCAHLEMETYTWEVLPPELKARSVVQQLAAEYAWTRSRLSEKGLL